MGSEGPRERFPRLERVGIIRTSGFFQTNSYVIECELGNLILDPGAGVSKNLRDFFQGTEYCEFNVVLTHAHYDHIAGIPELRVSRLFVSNEDCPLLRSPELNLSAAFGDPLTVETPCLDIDQQFSTIPAPGHTPGSRVLVFEGYIFTGDVVFSNTVGRSDLSSLPNAREVMVETLKRLRDFFLGLPPNWLVLPGHGEVVSLEKLFTINPFFKR